tara:strand:- start:1190 stop:1327 length:138 start_codon:yes stop_codon:yes gene_type:complete
MSMGRNRLTSESLKNEISPNIFRIIVKNKNNKEVIINFLKNNLIR